MQSMSCSSLVPFVVFILLLPFIKKKLTESSTIENYLYIYISIRWMKRIIAKSTLREFWEKHADSEQYLKTWYDTAKNAKWLSSNDVKQTYISASILKKWSSCF